MYRLLTWAKKDIAASKASIRRKKKNEIPPSPEVARKIEADVVSEIQKIHALNKQIATRDEFLSKVLMVAKCGVTLEDLKNILGPPDREDGFCEHYWGTFEVFACRGPVDFITSKNGEGPRKSLCRRD
ncbi:MAG: hypothetical protein IPK04_15505 [Bdellovibrionales bacterium]|nr:hypothetical protein [Bdellovibrionales bacterium]